MADDRDTPDSATSDATLPTDDRAGTWIPKIIRTAGDYKAEFGFFKPPPWGGAFGHYLTLYREGEKKWSDWAAYEAGINLGNSWVAGGEVPKAGAGEGAPEQEAESEEKAERELIDEFELNNVKIQVIKLTLLQIWVNVDNQRVIEVYREGHNFTPYWKLETALPAARRYVEITQGWSGV